MSDPAVTEYTPGAWKVLGSRPIAQDAVDKATGQAQYGIDVKLPRMIHARILRSPHAHARILSIDVSRAEALPGVLATATWRDVWTADERACPDKVGPDLKAFRDRYLASDKALYCGHPVAAVAALDPWLAEDALKLIDVTYEVLPVVMDPVLAIEPSSPLLHEGAVTRSLGGPPGREHNVATRIEHLKGDPDKGFAEADVVVEREFRVATVHQGYLEPQVTLAAWSLGPKPQGLVFHPVSISRAQ